MYDKGGQSVQQVRVINPHHHTTPTLLRDKGIDNAPHVCQRIRHRLAQRADECPKGQRKRRLGADDPICALTGRLGTPQHFAGQPRLAHTGGSGDYHAGMVANPA
jgi:hypothetical protein